MALEELQHLYDGFAALHVCLVNYDEREALESLVSLLALTAGQQRLLRCDHHLGGPVVPLGNEVGHLNVGVGVGDLTHLVSGLPYQLTHRGDDQRATLDAIREGREDHRLARAGEQANERGLHTAAHCVQQRFDHFSLVGAQSEHETSLCMKKPGGGRVGGSRPQPQAARSSAPSSGTLKRTLLRGHCPSSRQQAGCL